MGKRERGGLKIHHIKKGREGGFLLRKFTLAGAGRGILVQYAMGEDATFLAKWHIGNNMVGKGL